MAQPRGMSINSPLSYIRTQISSSSPRKTVADNISHSSTPSKYSSKFNLSSNTINTAEIPSPPSSAGQHDYSMERNTEYLADLNSHPEYRYSSSKESIY